jgi:hypothetical protein
MAQLTLENVWKIASVCSDTLTETIPIISKIKRGNDTNVGLMLDLRNDASRFEEWNKLLGQLLLSVDGTSSTREEDMEEWMLKELTLTLLSTFAQLQAILISSEIQGTGLRCKFIPYARKRSGKEECLALKYFLRQ